MARSPGGGGQREHTLITNLSVPGPFSAGGWCWSWGGQGRLDWIGPGEIADERGQSLGGQGPDSLAFSSSYIGQLYTVGL